MDIGLLVVDLVSLGIVTAVFSFRMVRQDAQPSDAQRPTLGDGDDYDFFGRNPLEDDYEADVHRIFR